MTGEQHSEAKNNSYGNFTPELFVGDYARTWQDINREQELIDLNQSALDEAIKRDRDPEDQKAQQRLKNIIDYLGPEIELSTGFRDDYLAAAAKNLTAAHAFLNSDASKEFYEDAYAELETFNLVEDAYAELAAHNESTAIGPKEVVGSPARNLALVNGNTYSGDSAAFIQNPYIPDGQRVASARLQFTDGNNDPWRPTPPAA